MSAARGVLVQFFYVLLKHIKMFVNLFEIRNTLLKKIMTHSSFEYT